PPLTSPTWIILNSPSNRFPSRACLACSPLALFSSAGGCASFESVVRDEMKRKNMNSKPWPVVLLTLLAVLMSAGVLAQGTFQNLDFESALVPPTPPGGHGGVVSASIALPGWGVLPGQFGEVYHN